MVDQTPTPTKHLAIHGHFKASLKHILSHRTSDNTSLRSISMVHPFFVDQRPYLPRSASSASASSSDSTSSSASSSISAAEHSTSFYASSCSSLAPSSSSTISITSSTQSHKRNNSTWSNSSDVPPEVDAACLRFMCETSNAKPFFGSVSSRESIISAEERRLRREALPEPAVEVKQRRRLGRIF